MVGGRCCVDIMGFFLLVPFHESAALDSLMELLSQIFHGKGEREREKMGMGRAYI